jgi:hypothetical protein
VEDLPGAVSRQFDESEQFEVEIEISAYEPDTWEGRTTGPVKGKVLGYIAWPHPSAPGAWIIHFLVVAMETASLTVQSHRYEVVSGQPYVFRTSRDSPEWGARNLPTGDSHPGAIKKGTEALWFASNGLAGGCAAASGLGPGEAVVRRSK